MGFKWYNNLTFGENVSINPFFYGTYLGKTSGNEPAFRSEKVNPSTTRTPTLTLTHSVSIGAGVLPSRCYRGDVRFTPRILELLSQDPFGVATGIGG